MQFKPFHSRARTTFTSAVTQHELLYSRSYYSQSDDKALHRTASASRDAATAQKSHTAVCRGPPPSRRTTLVFTLHDKSDHEARSRPAYIHTIESFLWILQQANFWR